MGTATLRVLFGPASRDAIEAHWAELEPRADPSFFTGWGWVGTWLDLIEDEAVPGLVSIRREGKLLAAALVGRARVARHRVVQSDALFLQQSGNIQFDGPLTIEHNGMLVDRTVGAEAHRALLAYLIREVEGWDEFELHGVHEQDPFIALAPEFDLSSREIGTSPSLYADLASIRNSKRSFLESLSGNTRYQVRRAMRRYEAFGALQVEEAKTPAEGLRFLDEMKILHQAYWTKKGMPGSFAAPFFERFHRALIKRRLPLKEIQLLKITAGDKTVGYLYNFVKGRCVASYQSGFWYAEDPKLRPGLVSHALAAQRALESGAERYDFLAGDGQYKRSLSNAEERLVWVALQKNRLRFQVENRLREAKHRAEPMLRGIAATLRQKVESLRGGSN